MPRLGGFALVRVQDLPAGEQGSQLAGLEQEAPRVSLAHVQRRDEEPARTDQTPHLREEWPVEEVEVAHQIPSAIEPDVRRLEVRHLRFDPRGDAQLAGGAAADAGDRKSTRLNS